MNRKFHFYTLIVGLLCFIVFMTVYCGADRRLVPDRRVRAAGSGCGNPSLEAGAPQKAGAAGEAAAGG